MEKFYKMIDEFNAKNKYVIDKEDLFKQVERAMKSPNYQKRDDALKAMMTEGFPEIGADYSAFLRKREVIAMAKGDESAKEADGDDNFFMKYANIISACATAIDPSYRPKYMLGLTLEESKTMLKNMMDSYTLREDVRNELLHVYTVDDTMAEINRSRVDSKTNTVRNYATAKPLEQMWIRTTYMRKEILKDELKNMGFWSWAFSSEAWTMRKIIRTAERALKDVKFTKEGVAEAKREASAPAPRPGVKIAPFNNIESCYKEHWKQTEREFKNSFFKIEYRPDLAKLKDHIKNANEIRAMIKEGKGNLSPDAKEVFEMNYEKIRLVTNSMKGKGISVADADSRCMQMEAEMAKKYADYQPATMDAFAKESIKESVKVNVEENTNAPTEPKKEEPSISKEPIVKDTI